jgi:hypothetical protein
MGTRLVITVRASVGVAHMTCQVVFDSGGYSGLTRRRVCLFMVVHVLMRFQCFPSCCETPRWFSELRLLVDFFGGGS